MRATAIGKTAWTGLSRHRQRTFLMMIGIVVGITALTLVLAAGLGAERRVMERVEKFGLSSVMVFAGGGTERGRTAGLTPTETLKLEDVDVLRREVPSVEELAPFARLPQTDIAWGGRSTTAPIFGVTPAWAPAWDWDAAEGDFVTEEDVTGTTRVAVLGPTVRRELFGDADPIGETIQLGNAPFVVKGVMEPKGTSPGGGDMDSRIYVPLSTLMRRMANLDYLSGVKIRLRAADNVNAAVPAIRAVLREQHRLAGDTPDDFSITTPAEVTKMAGEVAGTFNIFLVLVAGISLLAGGVVVANIMLISVNERRREIGLRKAVGASSADILQQFVIEATAISAAGGIVGILIGFVGARLLQWATATPTTLSWQSVAAGILFSSLVGVVAGLQPARRASRLMPVDALRG